MSSRLRQFSAALIRLCDAVGWITHNKQNSSVAEDGPPVEKSAAQAKFYEFLRTFQTETEDQQSSAVYKYRFVVPRTSIFRQSLLQHSVGGPAVMR